MKVLRFACIGFLAAEAIFLSPGHFFLFEDKEILAREIKIVKEVAVVATAYYKPVKNQKMFLTGSYNKEVRLNGKGITYSGDKAEIGVVAADIKKFPIGTTLIIPGYGMAVVKDIGGSIRGKKIDLFMGKGDDGLSKSINWGKKKINIFIVKTAQSSI